MKILQAFCAMLLALPVLAVTGCDAGYARTGQHTPQQDGKLHTAITEVIQRDAAFRQSDINVLVSRQGQVTLSGTVGSIQDKKRASEIVKQVAGIKIVNNELEVVTPGNTN
ncbi:BON domain-containing protein [Arsukibacterium tuosuense]|uniref:BON domain-containing protein n=1 Tax=Arsukibacterium tuosuense TaxID=1323745 RepID=A0A285INC2_9GAMM|nr:BON domain-containing protein [Arsukibacterium tuosuense]SNY49383.1 BON domain-containing protein [Arsukibacterium tuosuense]